MAVSWSGSKDPAGVLQCKGAGCMATQPPLQQTMADSKVAGISEEEELFPDIRACIRPGITCAGRTDCGVLSQDRKGVTNAPEDTFRLSCVQVTGR